jgi:uncharacterized membrane protein SpoIIM required for sporulation
MLEAIINPKSAEKRPWKMFFIGLVYASLSILLVSWFFSGDAVLSKFSGLIVVTFCVMFSLPFMYRMIKREEREDEEIEGFFEVWKVHSDVIFSFMWLFLGFVIAFSFWHAVIGNANTFNAQLETYCMINEGNSFEKCLEDFRITGGFLQFTSQTSMETSGIGRFLSILENNVFVMIFTLIFSLIFGAGAIFVLAWNATVISSAVGIFTKYSVVSIPLGLGRYMIHGLPEITAYFVTALAGGIFGVGVLRHGFNGKKIYRIIGNVIILLFIALLILIISAFVEVYLTPFLFK